MIDIEFETPHEAICDCCGEKSVRLTRFVYQNNDAFAYYYAEILPHVQDKKIKALLVICEFEGGEIIRKIGFPLGLWQNETGFAVSLLDADEVPWQNIDHVEILNRAQSLQHHYKSDVFKITDAVFAQDQEIIAFFNPSEMM